MIQGIFNLVFLFLFVGASLLPFWLIFRFWPAGGRMARFRWWAPPAALLLVLLWAAAMFQAFRTECGRGMSMERLDALAQPPRGVEVRGYRDWLHGGFGWGPALQQGTVDFVDEQIGTRTTRYCHIPNTFRYSTSCGSVAALASSMVIDVKAPRSFHWWAPALQVMEYEVREAGSGRLLVRASDVLFGGSIASMYLRLLKGDQDFDRLSCRYASTDIGPWRPSLSGRPRVAQYEAADLRLLRAAFP